MSDNGLGLLLAAITVVALGYGTIWYCFLRGGDKPQGPPDV